MFSEIHLKKIFSIKIYSKYISPITPKFPILLPILICLNYKFLRWTRFFYPNSRASNLPSMLSILTKAAAFLILTTPSTAFLADSISSAPQIPFKDQPLPSLLRFVPVQIPLIRARLLWDGFWEVFVVVRLKYALFLLFLLL